jgi:hypothetical protein
VCLAKGGLDGIERVTSRREALHGGDLAAVRLHGEEETGPHRLVVEQHGTGATHAVLAADVGPGEGQIVAEKVAQEEARLRLTVVLGAVDANADPYGCGHEIPGKERP